MYSHSIHFIQVRRSLKIRGRRKEKEKLPSGITADYSANFFAHLDLDRGGVERDRAMEEVLADGNATIDHSGESGENVAAVNVSQSDSSETSLQSFGANKVYSKSNKFICSTVCVICT